MKVLKKYSDRTIARSLVEEIESYGGDPGNLVMSSKCRLKILAMHEAS